MYVPSAPILYRQDLQIKEFEYSLYYPQKVKVMFFDRVDYSIHPHISY